MKVHYFDRQTRFYITSSRTMSKGRLATARWHQQRKARTKVYSGLGPLRVIRAKMSRSVPSLIVTLVIQMCVLVIDGWEGVLCTWGILTMGGKADV